MSTVVLAMAYEIVRLYGGWFISPKLMATYPDWEFADAMSYIKYAFVGVSLNENDGLTLTCLPSEYKDGKCSMPPLTASPFDGHAYNAYYGYNRYTIDFCFGLLIAYVIICRVIAYLALRYIKV
jgi:ATP-binding cassette subfamily G (WHITE) protein 2